MDLDSSEVRPRSLENRFPVLRLLRSVGIALEARKLVLAALGLVLSWAGWYGLDQAFGVSTGPILPEIVKSGTTTNLDPGTALSVVAEPLLVIGTPFLTIFQTDTSLIVFLHAILTALWGVVIWGIVGGAIARVAAVQQATGSRIGIATALGFAGRRAMALVGAPLCPMVGVGSFAALCMPIGLLYSIPGELGATIAGVFAFLPLLAGLVMALMLVGLAAGWPLMIATVAVEGEDVFDSLSRSYSYVFQRPGPYAIYALISWLLGAFGFVLVGLFAALIVHMAQWGLSLAGPDSRIASLYAAGLSDGTSAATAHGFWIFIVRLLAHGWIYSFFFTASTMIYLLLRRDVDGADYGDIGDLAIGVEPFAPDLEPVTGS